MVPRHRITNFTNEIVPLPIRKHTQQIGYISWGEKKEGEATREVNFILGFIATIGKINKLASEN